MPQPTTRQKARTKNGQIVTNNSVEVKDEETEDWEPLGLTDDMMMNASRSYMQWKYGADKAQEGAVKTKDVKRQLTLMDSGYNCNQQQDISTVDTSKTVVNDKTAEQELDSMHNRQLKANAAIKSVKFTDFSILAIITKMHHTPADAAAPSDAPTSSNTLSVTTAASDTSNASSTSSTPNTNTNSSTSPDESTATPISQLSLSLQAPRAAPFIVDSVDISERFYRLQQYVFGFAKTNNLAL
ncbi:hypothetical protein DFQ29_004923 [Apophysomyces sp. BC1021]|nr:hypothetical protein DFQ29_004923 [Apophysomyces sp. BC1021]